VGGPELGAGRGEMTLPSVQEVLDQEFHQLETSRNLRLGENPQRPIAQKSLIGLAFSGGGIRSATFNLGVLQALARKKLLRSMDYVSTVSGGGYIGGWLMG
jgi:predicted acylesterase/phospholipase RssA